MPTFIQFRLSLLAALCALPLLTGCLATYGMQEQQTAQQEDMAILQERIRRLEGRLEGFDLAIQQLQRAVEIMQAQPRGPSASDVETLQTRISALDGQLRSLDSARQRARQEIIDSLSSKIATLVNASGGSRSGGSSRPAANSGKRSANQEGYEHVVEPGQTLSAIAAAYNVRVQSIMDANNITKPESLRAGQKLFIPAP